VIRRALALLAVFLAGVFVGSVAAPFLLFDDEVKR
jgi:hypothetical protein